MASAAVEAAGSHGGSTSVPLQAEDTITSSVGFSQASDAQAPGKSFAPVRGYMEAPVRVVARFRPPITEDELQDDSVFVLRAGPVASRAMQSEHRGVAEAATVESNDGRFVFELDCAFGEEADQQSVYDRLGRPCVDQVLAGYNGTLMTYGQTGSGKTFSLFGPSLTEPELRGMAPRAAEQLVQQCVEDADEMGDCIILCSFLEIYRERMRDLLHPSNQGLRLRDVPQRGLVIDGLTQDYVGSAGDVLKALSTGGAWRSVAATRQNQYSSRSHAIFTLHVSRRSLTGDDGRERSGKLSLVDLAGSERVSRSQSTGETLEEAKKINSSLTALGKVIDALAERRTHVPYRDSMLTRVLEEALGGNSHTTLMVAASACAQYFDETVCSMRFATRAQKVHNCAHVNYIYSAEDLLPLVGQLQKELASVRRELALQHPACPAGLRPHQQNLPGGRRRCKTCSGSFDEEPSSRQNLAAPKSSEREATSAGFSRLSTCLDTPCSTSSGSRPPSDSMRGPHEEDEEGGLVGWNGNQSPPSSKALAASATAALRCLEETLLAQEEALEEARLLALAPEASSSNGAAGFAPSSSKCRHLRAAAAAAAEAGGAEAGAGGQERRPEGEQELQARPHDLLPRPVHTWAADGASGGDALVADSWRILRHAAEARALRWRCQRERHRAEGLHHELGLRNRYTAELERRLEASQAQVALLTQNAASASSSREGAQHAAANARGGATSPPIRSPNASKCRSRAASMSSVLSPGGGGTPTAAGSPPTAACSSEQLRAPKDAQSALRGEVLELKQEAASRDRQLAGLAAELAAREVRVSALRHEVSVKDALLGCLRREAARSAEDCDEELERLLESAAAPLAGLLRGKPVPSAVAGQPSQQSLAVLAPAPCGGNWTPVRPPLPPGTTVVNWPQR